MRKIMYWSLCALIFINVLYVFSGVLNFPLRSVDAYSDWMFKAKVLFVSSSFPLSYFQNWEYMSSHMQYPILLPFLISLAYRVIGFQDRLILFVYPFIYTAILFMCWKSLRALRIHPHIAVACTYIYSMLSPLLAQGGRAHAGNADIVLVFLYWIAIYIIVRGAITKWSLALLVFVAMIASQIKSEGALLVTLFFFLPISRKTLFTTVGITLIPTIFWNILVKKLQFASDILYAPITIHEFLLRTGAVIYGYLVELINYRNWYIFWILCILLMFIPTHISIKTKKILLPTAFLMLFMIMGSYVFAHFARTEIQTLRYVTSSADRVLFQLSPFIFMYFAEAISLVIRPYFSWPKVAEH